MTPHHIDRLHGDVAAHYRVQYKTPGDVHDRLRSAYQDWFSDRHSELLNEFGRDPKAGVEGEMLRREIDDNRCRRCRRMRVEHEEGYCTDCQSWISAGVFEKPNFDDRLWAALCAGSSEGLNRPMEELP